MTPTSKDSSKESDSDNKVECYEAPPVDTTAEDIMDASSESPKEYRLYRQRFVGLVALVCVPLLCLYHIS